jgi:cytochrome c biogenesis protein CcdA
LARVIGLVVAIALGDSLNPSTIAPALYVASGERPRRRVLEFTTAVFLVHLAGGAILLIGPGQLLLSLLDNLGKSARNLLELGAGVAMIAAASILWHQRRRLAQKELPDPNPKRQSSALLGATIIAVELPTAFPYFAALAAILGSGGSGPGEMLELAIYNLCFVLPLIAILATLLIAGDHADARLRRGRDRLQQRWPVVLATLLLLVGTFVGALGATGL